MNISHFIRDNRFKIFKTLVAYAAYFCLGGSITLIGSSLLDLQTRVATDFATASYTITVRSIGHIFGAVMAGVVGSKLNLSCILCLSSLFSGIFFGISLFFTNFYYVAISLFLSGIVHGLVEIICNAMLASTWKENCANWLQVLHMCWGIGSLVTPVICRPFLLPEKEEISSVNITSNSSDIEPSIEKLYTSDDVIVQYAYLIIAGCSMVLVIPFGYMYFKERDAVNRAGPITRSEKVEQNYSPLKVYTAVVMVASISHLVHGAETVLGSLGPLFAVLSDLHMEKKTRVLLTTVFWACFSFYRCIYVPLTFFISQAKLLLSSLTITTVGLLILIPWANYYTICIWTGCVLVGIGVSPMFSASYGMLAKYITITSSMSSMIFIPGVLGESIHPGIAATFMDKNPIVCLYYVGVLGLLFITIYLILLVYCDKMFKPILGNK